MAEANQMAQKGEPKKNESSAEFFARHEANQKRIILPDTSSIDRTWEAIMGLQEKETRVVNETCNSLEGHEIETILATAEFFNFSDAALSLMLRDLRYTRYRLFDCFAMFVDALRGRPEHPDIATTREGMRVLAYSFLKADGDVDEFIADLRETDYDIDKSYERVVL